MKPFHDRSDQLFRTSLEVQGVLSQYEHDTRREAGRKLLSPHLRLKIFYERLSKVHEFLGYCESRPIKKERPLHVSQLEELTSLKSSTIGVKFRHCAAHYGAIATLLEPQETPSALKIICISFLGELNRPSSYYPTILFNDVCLHEHQSLRSDQYR